MSRDDAIQNVWSKDTVFRMETTRTLPVGLPDSDGVSLNTWYLEMFQDISL